MAFPVRCSDAVTCLFRRPITSVGGLAIKHHAVGTLTARSVGVVPGLATCHLGGDQLATGWVVFLFLPSAIRWRRDRHIQPQGAPYGRSMTCRRDTMTTALGGPGHDPGRWSAAAPKSGQRFANAWADATTGSPQAG